VPFLSAGLAAPNGLDGPACSGAASRNIVLPPIKPWAAVIGAAAHKDETHLVDTQPWRVSRRMG
jgi:hypothetical protein